MPMKKTSNIIICAVSVPIVLFEYLILLWFWGGADVFNFILTPVIFAIYLIGLIYFKKRIKVKAFLDFLIKVLIVISLPILTIASVRIFALLLGINIMIL